MALSDTQFKPGNLANPGGRPKHKPIADAYRRLCSMDDAGIAAFTPKTGAEIIAWAMFSEVQKGGKAAATAAEIIADRAEGKVPTETRLEGNLTGPVDSARLAVLVQLALESGKPALPPGETE